jgi:hypothetical protein
MTPLPVTHPTPDRNAVLTKAVLRAADLLNLPQKDLAEIIGASPSSVTRMAQDTKSILHESKEGQLAVQFLRLFRSLDAIVGGSQKASIQWFHGRNIHLNGRPVELVKRPEGLIHVVDYLDAMRGR